MCLAQGHNAVTPMRFESATRFGLTTVTGALFDSMVRALVFYSTGTTRVLFQTRQRQLFFKYCDFYRINEQRLLRRRLTRAFAVRIYIVHIKDMDIHLDEIPGQILDVQFCWICSGGSKGSSGGSLEPPPHRPLPPPPPLF